MEQIRRRLETRKSVSACSLISIELHIGRHRECDRHESQEHVQPISGFSQTGCHSVSQVEGQERLVVRLWHYSLCSSQHAVTCHRNPAYTVCLPLTTHVYQRLRIHVSAILATSNKNIPFVSLFRPPSRLPLRRITIYFREISAKNLENGVHRRRTTLIE